MALLSIIMICERKITNMRKRLIGRADDVGYTFTYDLGFKRAVEEGYVTAADVMLDSPDTVEILKWLRERPYISIGWHTHLWEKPVLPADQVPSLVDEEGRFKWRHKKDYLKAEATYDDAYRELCAEVDRCIEVYGKAPGYTMWFGDDTELSKAFLDVCHKYNINLKFWDTIRMPKFDPSSDRRAGFDLKIFDQYKPIDSFKERLSWENDGDVQLVVGHPGYLDEHIFKESSCSIHRLVDLDLFINPEMINYIIENKIELVNSDDVCNGTDTYQQYLKSINSPLWVGNF